MYPLVTQANARHRREPSVRQRVRASLVILAALTLIAAFGVFGASVLGGQSLQARVLNAVPVPDRVFGWAVYALPLTGLFGLLAPTRLRLLRIALSLLLLVPGVLLMVMMSRPRGVQESEWAVAPEFAHAQSVSAYALLIALLAWAMVATVVVTMGRFADAALKVRRTVLWAGPLTIGGSLVAALAL
jgi:hypothetical protein